MPVPSSSITIAAIAAEIGGQSAPHTLSTLAGLSTGTFSAGGNNSAPHGMHEWAGYSHTQAFSGITYLLRTGTTTSSYGMRELTDAVSPVPEECVAEGGMFLTRIIAGNESSGTTKIYGDVMKASDLDQLDNAEGTINRRYAANGTYATMGSFANNTGPIELISIPVYDVTVTAATTLLSGEGTGFADNDVTGLATNHTIIPGSAKGADDAEASGNGTEHISAYWKYTLTISKTGYQTTTLTDFVTFSRHQASAETEGE